MPLATRICLCDIRRRANKNYRSRLNKFQLHINEGILEKRLHFQSNPISQALREMCGIPGTSTYQASARPGIALILIFVWQALFERIPASNKKGQQNCRPLLLGAPGRSRTGTPLRIQDFESSASTSSTTGAFLLKCRSLLSRPQI